MTSYRKAKVTDAAGKVTEYTPSPRWISSPLTMPHDVSAALIASLGFPHGSIGCDKIQTEQVSEHVFRLSGRIDVQEYVPVEGKPNHWTFTERRAEMAWECVENFEAP